MDITNEYRIRITHFVLSPWEHLSIYARLEKNSFKYTRLQARRIRLDETLVILHLLSEWDMLKLIYSSVRLIAIALIAILLY